MVGIYLINLILGGTIIGLIGNKIFGKKLPIYVVEITTKDEVLKWGLLIIHGILLSISCGILSYTQNQEIINQISPYLNMAYIYSNTLNINIGFLVDGVSAIFILLTIILTISCILISWQIITRKEQPGFYALLLIIELLLINFFVAGDIIQFYIIYEAILIPIVFMISTWGSREEKKIAAFQILIYTLIGSIFFLIAILYIYNSFGTTDYFIVKELIEILPDNVKKFIFICFFLGFAVKIPIVPLHLWLLRAHVEAPTAGSVLLAGILLKLGGYGYIRYNVGMLNEYCDYFYPAIAAICLISILYTGIATLTQLDVKRIIAYSSISHMNIAVLGVFSGNLQAIEGGIILMISHGVVSGGLFLCIGVLYDRFKTRLLYAYSNVVQVMPILAICFFLLVLANVAFPLTSSFVGELLIFVGLIKKNIIVAFFSGLSMIITAIYSFWLYNRIFFMVKETNNVGNKIYEITTPLVIHLLYGHRLRKENYVFNKTIEKRKKTVKAVPVILAEYNTWNLEPAGVNLIPDEIKNFKEKRGEVVTKIRYADLNKYEMASIIFMIFWVIIFGFWPNLLESIIRNNVLSLIA